INGGFCQMAESKLSGGQNAKHDGGATDELRPEQFVEVRGLGLHGAQSQSYGEKEEPKRSQETLVDSPHQKSCNRRGDQLGNAGHQHDLADLKRIMRPDIGEKDRHQVDRSKETCTEHEAEQAADRKIPVAKGSQVHQWV